MGEWEGDATSVGTGMGTAEVSEEMTRSSPISIRMESAGPKSAFLRRTAMRRNCDGKPESMVLGAAVIWVA